MNTRGPILVDTSVWIDFFSPSPGRAGAELRQLIAEAGPIVLAGVVVTEILQGLVRDAERVGSYLSKWELLEPQGFATYAHAAELFRLARSRGLTLTTVDVLIAALTLEHGASLLTLDRDFARLAKLIPLDLYQAG